MLNAASRCLQPFNLNSPATTPIGNEALHGLVAVSPRREVQRTLLMHVHDLGAKGAKGGKAAARAKRMRSGGVRMPLGFAKSFAKSFAK